MKLPPLTSGNDWPRQKVKPYYLRQRRMLPNHEKSPSLRRGNLHLTGVRSPTTPARSTDGARGIQTCFLVRLVHEIFMVEKLGRYSAARIGKCGELIDELRSFVVAVTASE
jgi:hypothetical protein